MGDLLPGLGALRYELLMEERPSGATVDSQSAERKKMAKEAVKILQRWGQKVASTFTFLCYFGMFWYVLVASSDHLC